ncbi:MCP four helix bundle domain-containing protein [Duganella sp. BJB1802]|uniref:methyl-accepting chemotaxis protein n=1 Tax=Duganella sp. BJB1802 TaxID=2744575 RepID=UPI001594B988|nr:methyl-accepting chemotaxis protein [Duganella sp. BJB1802]NVD74437.1 MCP four helix bundle domain-containing protein [Duganella sp. BJB1802]
MSFANIRIAGRLGAGFGLVLTLMASLIVVCLMHLADIGETSGKMIEKDWVKAEAANVIDATTRANARRSMELLIAPDKAYADKVREQIEVNKKTISEALAMLDRLVYLPEGRALLAKIKEQRARYVVSFSKVGKLVAEDQREQATSLMIAETLPMLDVLQGSVKELTNQQKKIVEASGGDIKQNIASSRRLMVGLGLAALLIGVAFAYGITRSITRPISEAVKVAETVAAGDLTSHIDIRSTDEIGQLLQALKVMNDNLRNIVGQVRIGTDTIATASAQIAAGNFDLSARTEGQASSLEQTASSMEELTSIVKQNADNARQANQLAASASEVAVKGGGVVAQVVDTMSSINASSRKIVDIISVVDGIAFQTNILALNAAVEAARAGEQGRGFAVVASEVRNLAQRSAAAAKEIKTLIDDSVDKVDVGAKLVGQAGATMGEIVDSVKRVTEIMSEITTAGQEQTLGIEQINQAIVQMDEVTQQNAALVEEAAAAAGALQDQANNLSQVVGVFKLDGAHTAVVMKLEAAGHRTPMSRQAKAPVATDDVRPLKRVAHSRASAESDWEEF